MVVNFLNTNLRCGPFSLGIHRYFILGQFATLDYYTFEFTSKSLLENMFDGNNVTNFLQSTTLSNFRFGTSTYLVHIT